MTEIIVNLSNGTNTRNRVAFNQVGRAGGPGATGPVGPSGPPGPGGGATGPTGPKGDPGGATGATGPVGATGVGATGPRGIQGEQGPMGLQGVTGPSGPSGPTGPQGPVGAGLTILGTLASTDDLPTTAAEGDGYIINGQLYVWTGDEWTNVGVVQGPTGPQGASGVAGSQGATGPQGTDGATGPQGPIGATGPQGLQGTQGNAGTAGPTGASGPVGATGVRGFTGPQGATGPAAPPTPRVTTITSSATPSVNVSSYDVLGITALTTNIASVTVTGSPVNAQKLWIYIVGTATRTISWGAAFEDSSIPLPTVTDGTTRLDVGFIYNSATNKWRCVGTA